MTNVTFAPALPRKRTGTVQTVIALMLREMSATYGRSALGYLWAVLEPVAGIFLLTFIFSLGFKSPSLGTNFPLFFATGILPFMAYMDISNKMSVSLRFSKQLLFYPGVTYTDALIARFILNVITSIMIAVILLPLIIIVYDLNVIVDMRAIAWGYTLTFALGAGVGTLNCFLLSVFPIWERAWAVLNRPLLIISGVIFLFDTVPLPYRDWMWWNPLIHPIGLVRKGIYSTYDATYVSSVFVMAVSGITLALGLLLLRRYHRDIINF
ncbi:Transport permease protein [Roseovarius sp. EC-HK134]|jgi:capsular polysaccharide transport system permease protein|uniref:Transport permease protein n=1 Tax=Roseovarius mucosus TaxID=215743 RepID=A0A1V0RQB4_9RHOB|nr:MULTISPECIES: ABC transporter permease [Roseovarius]ARE83782.1 polysialic acid transport protein KpsM [Roseovarius mucosus]AWZ19584.1 Structural element protein [Roseovarius sp. AK1035]EDM33757.1 putative cell surface polysaccharide export ABC-2 transporter permease protein, close relative of Y20822wzm2 [Roseovarius sp. TM1035]MBW4973330.1 ABC transporter permease [Roseovarius mucosus]VVT08449.1 Transport permease protein [Roseovarius sp. EC-HK134]|tara:strand:+ start:9138 stop:9938 length:801 start_codon:yes stop_codon:yes gene_type:complete